MNPLIVAGFHQSGTSAIARSLHLGGLFLGDDLLGSEPSNPYGHFEDNEVITIHQDESRTLQELLCLPETIYPPDKRF